MNLPQANILSDAASDLVKDKPWFGPDRLVVGNEKLLIIVPNPAPAGKK